MLSMIGMFIRVEPMLDAQSITWVVYRELDIVIFLFSNRKISHMTTLHYVRLDWRSSISSQDERIAMIVNQNIRRIIKICLSSVSSSYCCPSIVLYFHCCYIMCLESANRKQTLNLLWM
jgi:hypothetical protein